jgi:hypothetical protein
MDVGMGMPTPLCVAVAVARVSRHVSRGAVQFVERGLRAAAAGAAASGHAQFELQFFETAAAFTHGAGDVAV